MKKKDKKMKTTGTGTGKETDLIPCEWVQIPSSTLGSDKKTRCGRYHRSVFPAVNEFGIKRWVVVGYLKMKEPSKYEHLSENQIVEGCVAFLNQPPPRKRKSVYGSLKPVPALWRGPRKYEVKFTPEHMIILLSTDQKKNKNFWDSGISYA